ncbi:DUF3866 family protein [Brachybacterium sp. DNPG3]
MLRWERGTVVEVRDSWPGVVRLRVAITSAAGAAGAGESVAALAYPELTGAPQVGEQVLLNTNALRRGLGTGGEALVVARPDALPEADEPAGHMVKARYTPMQTMVDAIDDPSGEHHDLLQDADDLAGLPVVVADLHSALPAVVAGIRAQAPSARIVHVHTDAAALPAAFSRTAAVLREEGLMEATISVGQAFGGDHEAVTVHSALLAARLALGADVVIAVQGPGNLGTGTAWGFSGVQAVEALHAASVLGGVPIAALRVSGADPRPRHRGLSHHASTVLGRAALAPLRLPVLSPADPLNSAFHASVAEQVREEIVELGRARGILHAVEEIDADGLLAALAALPVRLSSMGRGLEEDAAPFLYPALAGRAAGRLLDAG